MIPDLVFLQFENAAAHPGIRVHDGARADVHHAVGLESIEIQVIKNLIEGIRRVVVVNQFLSSFKLMVPDIEIDNHFVFGPLLPALRLSLGKGGCKEKDGQ